MGKISQFNIFFLAATIAAVLLASVGPDVRADESEYRVKAAFIYNFLKFVEWPSAADSSVITLCFLGDPPFDDNIENSVLKGKVIGDKKIIIKHVASLDEIKGCNAVFISESEKDRISQVVHSLRSSGVLTIGDTNSFGRKGVMINMYVENEKVRFAINLKTAKQAGIRINSQLLKLARIVQE